MSRSSSGVMKASDKPLPKRQSGKNVEPYGTLRETANGLGHCAIRHDAHHCVAASALRAIGAYA